MRILRHLSAFIPDGPAAPLVLIADAAILDSSILSKMTGSQNGTSPVSSIDSSGSAPFGCFCKSSLSVEFVRFSTPFEESSSSNLRAAFTFLARINFANLFDFDFVFDFVCFFFSVYWIVLASQSKESKSPLTKRAILLFKHSALCLVEDL